MASLQRNYGTQAIFAMLSRSAAVQPKLRISEAGDPYEQEAARVADGVMRMPGPAAPTESPTPAADEPPLRRKCAECEEEDKLRRKEAGIDGFEPWSRRRSCTMCLPPLGNGWIPQPALFEPRFGYDFSSVRIHRDKRAAESARAVNALAYTVGTNVVLGPGLYPFQTAHGKRVLAHELSHVIQQSAGPHVVQRWACDDIIKSQEDPDRTRGMGTAIENQIRVAASSSAFGLPSRA
jgi:hypothetical protein